MEKHTLLAMTMNTHQLLLGSHWHNRRKENDYAGTFVVYELCKVWDHSQKKRNEAYLYGIIQQYATASVVFSLPKLLLQSFGRMGN